MEIVSRDNAEHYIWGEICDGWHLLKTSGLSIIQERVPPGGAETLHYHRYAQQFFFVLAGEATMEIEQRQLLLGAQQGISIPPGMPHRLLNAGQQDLIFLVISSPLSHGDRIAVNQTLPGETDKA